jgi:hypothetical protein
MFVQDVLPTTYEGNSFGPVNLTPPTIYRLVTP